VLSTQHLRHDFTALREQAPLVHNITNYVVMNLTANALLAVGASPIMAHAEEELDELLGLAGALVLNIGTLSGPWIGSMRRAAEVAGRRGVPIVLDPVGAGASRLRTETALALLATAPVAVVRGNASEILALAGAVGGTKGVDSSHDTRDAAEAARGLAKAHGCAVAVSGAEDFITDGATDVRLHGGSPLMPRVTGMGCTATAMVGAFAAVSSTPLRAAAGGMAAMKVAGELAAEEAEGPGSFVPRFLDALYGLTPDVLAGRTRLG
jgi:hydroxyethylthiazole kinase